MSTIFSLKEKINQGDIVIVNIYAPNERVTNFTKKTQNTKTTSKNHILIIIQ